MKKNIVVALFAGTILTMAACGGMNSSSNDSNTESTEAIVLTEDQVAKISSPKLSEKPKEVAVQETENTDDSLNVEESEYKTIEADANGVLTNGTFSIEMPKDFDGKYLAFATDNSIQICEKEGYEAGFGGHVFTILVYDNPSDYAGGMDMKVGEIKSSDGTVKDVVRLFASDVQWDYQEYDDGPEAYKNIFDSFEAICKTLKPVEEGEFAFGAGTKGEDIYGDILKQVKQDIEEGTYTFDLDKMGYVYYDTNIDGVEELLIGEIADGDDKGVVYDIYTVVNREPKRVVAGYENDRYFVQDGGMLVNESLSDAEDKWILFDIEPNTTNILPQYILKMEKNEGTNSPYYVNFYPDTDSWESISEDDFNMYKDRMVYERFDFTPLSEVK